MHNNTLIYVYKSSKKEGYFVYTYKKDDFSFFDDLAKQKFGEPKLILTLSKNQIEKLKNVDLEKLQNSLDSKGFFIRIDLTKEENLLEEYRKRLGLPPLIKN